MPPTRDKGWGASQHDSAGQNNSEKPARSGTKKHIGSWAAKIAAAGTWDVLSLSGLSDTKTPTGTCPPANLAGDSDAAESVAKSDVAESVATQNTLKPTTTWDSVKPAEGLNGSKPVGKPDTTESNDTWNVAPTVWDATGPSTGWETVEPPTGAQATTNPASSWDWMAENPSPKTEEQLRQEKVDKALEGWPWTGIPSKLLTLGPYIFNEFPDDRKKGDRSRSLTKEISTQNDCLLLSRLFKDQIVFQGVMKFVCRSHDSQWKFAATCKSAWNMLVPNAKDGTTDLWDISRGTFNNCEKGPVEDRRGNLPVVKPVLMIAPLRGTSKPGYSSQVKNLHKMCIAINHLADYIRNIQFHRVPFLTIDLLALLIPQMRSLTHVGVYKCQLIHFGETIPLLDIIKTDRPLERENQVNLDFYPNYHRGPVHPQSSAGPYGVTWDNWNGNSILGIWCLMTTILPMARERGIDLVGKGTMFRKWLDDGPCWRVDEVLSAVQDPTYDTTALVALLDCNNPQHYGSVRMFTGFVGNRPEGWEWTTSKFRCAYCKSQRLGMFFWWGHVRLARTGHQTYDNNHLSLMCYGCMLDQVLRHERDHFKNAKQCIIQNWLLDWDEDEAVSQLNSTDLPRAITEFDEKDVSHRAASLQRRRNVHIAEKGYDRETQEEQVPLTHKEKNTKYGTRLRSPVVWDKNSDPKRRVYKNPGDMEWDFVPHSSSTRFAHGRW